MAATGAVAAGAATVVTGQQQQVFAWKHAELLSEARGVAREHGVTVRTVAFRPDGTAVAHELVGVGREERLRWVVGRAVAADVSAMGPRELATHLRQLHALRAVVLRELQAKKTDTAAEDDDGDDADAETNKTKTKRALAQPEADGAGAAGSNKSRRTDY